MDVTHAGSDDPVPVAEPHDSASLDARMPIGNAHGVGTGSGIIQAKLLVSAGLYVSSQYYRQWSGSHSCFTAMTTFSRPRQWSKARPSRRKGHGGNRKRPSHRLSPATINSQGHPHPDSKGREDTQ